MRQRLEADVRQRGLKNVAFKPYQPRGSLAASLSVPDLHWISLLPQLEGLILPSKLYGIAAAGRPLCMIGDRDGDIGRIISRYKIGFCFEPGESDAVAEAILKLAGSVEEQHNLGQAARHYIEVHASRRRAFSLWQTVLTEA